MIQCISLSTYFRVSNDRTASIKHGKFPFIELANRGQFNVVIGFGINLIAQHVKGITHIGHRHARL